MQTIYLNQQIQKLKERNRRLKIYLSKRTTQNKFFHHDIFKDLRRRTVSGTVLHDKAFDTAKNTKYDGYQRDFTSMVYKFFGKKPAKRTGNISAMHTDIASDSAVKS